MRKIKFRNILKSIYDAPETWENNDGGFMRDDHMMFFVGGGFWKYDLLIHGISKLTFWQKVRFHRAFNKWKKCRI